MSAGAPPHQVPVVDAARWMLQRAEGDGIAIDLRRLHEICCYAQGLYHVKRGVPLFIEPVLATDAGPVFPAIEAEFRDGDLTPSATPVELPRILQAVVMREAMRTSDAPWRAAIAKCSSGTEIAAEEIARFILRSPSADEENDSSPPDWDRAMDLLQRPDVIEAVTGHRPQAAGRVRRWA